MNKVFHWKKAFLLIGSMLLLAWLFFQVGALNPAVKFTDPELEAAVREKIDLPEGSIYHTDVRSLTELDASNRGIENLEGIDQLNRLVALNLEGNKVTDVTPLARLSMLKELNLRDNGITDLHSVGFNSLRKVDLRLLDLRHNVSIDPNGVEIRLSGIELLTNFPNLESLHLRDNHIKDATPIIGLRNLVTLDVSQNPITDFSFLSALTLLEELNLRETDIVDLSVIETLDKLTYLNLHSNLNIASITPLYGLHQLETLILKNVPIGSQLGGLINSTRLQRLNLSNCAIEDITVLSNFPALRHLELNDNRIADISSLQGHVLLEELHLGGNHLVDITPIANFVKLRVLDLGDNKEIQSVLPLYRLHAIESLILRDVFIGEHADLLAKMTKLKVLDLRNTGITSIQAIEDHFLLKELNLRENDIRDINGLKNLRHLTYLNLHSNNRISSIAPLAGLTKLETLILENVQIGDQHSVFEEMVHLRRVNVNNTGITDGTIFHFLRAEGSLEHDVLAEYTLPPPIVSHPGGFYSEPLEIAFASAVDIGTVHYTLDGSEPTAKSSRFTDPIAIPLGQVKMIRGKIFGVDGAMSPTVTHTYFTDQHLLERNNMMVLSLSTDPNFLFDPNNGVLADENRWKTGREWERPVTIEAYEKDGSLAFKQNVGIRIHGSYTRILNQRSFRLYARSEYDNQNYFNYDIFPGNRDMNRNEPLDQYKRLLLRTSGNDFNSALFRDALAHELTEPMKTLDTQAYRPAVLFINGSYWGIRNLREALGPEYLEANYHVDEENVTILVNNAMDDQYSTTTIDHGSTEDDGHYLNMLNYIRNNGVKDKVHYEYIKTQMDTDNYRDYLIAQTYFGNQDWPHNNVRYWRYKTDAYNKGASYGLDGRWRWIFFDADFAFGRHSVRTDRFGSQMNVTHDTLNWILDSYDGQYGGLIWPNFLPRSLLANEEFRMDFINRYADLMNSYFHPQVADAKILSTREILAPEIPFHISRWNVIHSTGTWNKTVQDIRDYAKRRPDYMRSYLMRHFHLSGTAKLKVDLRVAEGTVQVNTLWLDESLPTFLKDQPWEGIYFKGVPVTLQAVPNPGYIFSHWEGTDTNEESQALQLTLTKDLVITPVFKAQ